MSRGRPDETDMFDHPVGPIANLPRVPVAGTTASEMTSGGALLADRSAACGVARFRVAS